MESDGPWEHAVGVRVSRGFEVLTPVVMRSYTSRRITLYSPLNVNRSFEITCLLHLQGQARNVREADSNQSSAGSKNKPNRKSVKQVASSLLVSCLVCFSNLKMKATCSSEISGDFQRTTRRYVPEDGILQIHSGWFGFGKTMLRRILLGFNVIGNMFMSDKLKLKWQYNY
jgi:hypothetical protein